MKSTANLVNIARGPIVDTDALVQALTVGQIR
jgi:lactate dehydrogenase-like 2-hydroxyacid dehydrogenase